MKYMFIFGVYQLGHNGPSIAEKKSPDSYPRNAKGNQKMPRRIGQPKWYIANHMQRLETGCKKMETKSHISSLNAQRPLQPLINKETGSHHGHHLHVPNGQANPETAESSLEPNLTARF